MRHELPCVTFEKNKGFKAITLNTYTSTVYWELMIWGWKAVTSVLMALKTNQAARLHYAIELSDQCFRVFVCWTTLNSWKQAAPCAHTHTHTLRLYAIMCECQMSQPNKRTMNQQIRHDTVWALRKNSWVQRFLNGTPKNMSITFCKNRRFLWAETCA